MPGRKLEWIKLRKTTQRQASLQGFYRRIASHEYRALYRWESGFFLSCVILTDMKHFLFFFWRCHANCTIISSNSKIHFVDKEAADFCVFMFFTWMGFYYHLQCIRHRLRYKSVASDYTLSHDTHLMISFFTFNKLCNLDHYLGLLCFLLQLICNAGKINFLDVNRIFIGGSMSLFEHGFWHQCQLWLHAMGSCKSLIQSSHFQSPSSAVKHTH